MVHIYRYFSLGFKLAYLLLNREEYMSPKELTAAWKLVAQKANFEFIPLFLSAFESGLI